MFVLHQVWITSCTAARLIPCAFDYHTLTTYTHNVRVVAQPTTGRATKVITPFSRRLVSKVSAPYCLDSMLKVVTTDAWMQSFERRQYGNQKWRRSRRIRVAPRRQLPPSFGAVPFARSVPAPSFLRMSTGGLSRAGMNQPRSHTTIGARWVARCRTCYRVMRIVQDVV